MSSSSHLARARFATTNWSLVRQLQGPEGSSALAALCEQYWFPLYVFARRKLNNDHDARDSTQAFFAWLLEKDLFRRAAADRGRLRSFLLTSLQNFLRNEQQSKRRQIRGGHAQHFSLDFNEGSSQFTALPVDAMTAERLFDRSWALVLLERVMSRLQDEAESLGQGQRFRVLKPTLASEHTETYEEIAARLGTTAAAARQAASRLRKRYQQLLLEEVQATLADPADATAEIRELFLALRPG